MIILDFQITLNYMREEEAYVCLEHLDLFWVDLEVSLKALKLALIEIYLLLHDYLHGLGMNGVFVIH